MRNDWFEGLARNLDPVQSKPWATRATRATLAENSQNFAVLGEVDVVAQPDLRRATRATSHQQGDHESDRVAHVAQGHRDRVTPEGPPKTQEFCGFQEPVACVAHVARKFDLSRKAIPWSRADYRAYFDERAGIAERDGGAPRLEAERLAYNDVVAVWLHRHPPGPQPEDRCSACGCALGATGPHAVPLIAGPGACAWVHHRCIATWHARCRARAIKALKRMGLSPTLSLHAASTEAENPKE